MAIAEFQTALTSDDLYEVIDDQIVKMADGSAESTGIANVIAFKMNSVGSGWPS